MLNNDNSRFWVKGMRRRTTVILASRAAPPQAAGSQKYSDTTKIELSKEMKLLSLLIYIVWFIGCRPLAAAQP